jgi:hypothetical protein
MKEKSKYKFRVSDFRDLLEITTFRHYPETLYPFFFKKEIVGYYLYIL